VDKLKYSTKKIAEFLEIYDQNYSFRKLLEGQKELLKYGFILKDKTFIKTAENDNKKISLDLRKLAK
jgi:hypothetical protein